MRRIGPPAHISLIFGLALGVALSAGAEPAPCCANFRGAELPVGDSYFEAAAELDGELHLTEGGDVLYSYLYPAPSGAPTERMLAVYSLGEDRLVLECPFASGDTRAAHIAKVATGPLAPLAPVVPNFDPAAHHSDLPAGDVFVRNAGAQGTANNISYNTLTVVDATGMPIVSTALVYLYDRPKTMDSPFGFDGYVEETRWLTRLTTLPPTLYELPDGSLLLASDRAPILLRFDRSLVCIGCEALDNLRMVPKPEFDRTLFALEDEIRKSFGIGRPDATPALIAANFELARDEGTRSGLPADVWAPNLWVNWKLADHYESWHPGLGQ